MGDRISVKIEPTNVYLYSHWGGSDMAQTLERALIRGRSRWDDPVYLARIIFSEMIREDIDGLTGYGIDTQDLGDDNSTIVINCDKQTVNGTPLEDWVSK